MHRTSIALRRYVSSVLTGALRKRVTPALCYEYGLTAAPKENAVDTSTVRPARFPLLTDAEPNIHAAALWRILVRAAIIGIFLLLLISFLESARTILMPVLAAIVVGTMMGPLTLLLEKHGIPSTINAVLI